DATITYDGPDERGDTIVLTSFRSVSADDDGDEELTATTITITGGDVSADGPFIADALVAEDITATTDEGGARAASFELAGVTLNTKTDDENQPSARFDNASVVDIAFYEDGRTVATVARVAVSNCDFNGI